MKCEDKERKAKEKAEKAAKDKAKREAKKMECAAELGKTLPKKAEG
jgi:hypothetical protein